MEYSGKPAWDNYTKESFQNLTVESPDRDIYRKVLQNWDSVAKPLDGMGRFEALTAQIGAIQSTTDINIAKKAVLILCSDNGIVEEGISQSGQEVTFAVMKNMAEKRSCVGKMAESIGVDTIPVDIGVNQKERVPGVLDRKIRSGTRNFKIEPAMTEEEAARAICTGIELVSDCKRKGYHILATGEMGIGNTTTSSVVTAALLGCDAKEVAGRGAGLSDEKLRRKREIVTEAIEKYNLKNADAFEILRTAGGFDIAGLAGICIGGAVYHIPVVLDGVISLTAALLAERLVSGVGEYLLPSHKGKEPAVEMLLEKLRMRPVIDAEMALGEGTGAVMMFPLLDMALCIYRNRTTFSDIRIGQYERFGN